MSVIRAALAAMAFLTQIPVWRTSVPPPRVSGLSVGFFPLIGLLLGGVSMGVAWGIREGLHAPPHVVWAILLVGLHALLTGALHLDGLGDVADGMGGGRGDRERSLEIMQDSRSGSFGVVTLVLFLAAKVAVTNEVLRMEEGLMLLLLYPVSARFAVVPLVVFFPCARQKGLARDFHERSGWAALCIALVLAGMVFWIAGSEYMIAGVAALGTALITGVWAYSRLKGLTGDVYGAAIELSELGFLIAGATPILLN